MPDQLEFNVVFIAGPTASGKSALALDLADRLGGEIVNADAMQVYRDLRIVTARPSTAEEARAPHHLYGVVDGAERCSAGRWARMAAPIIDDIGARGRCAIVVGGTGLYFRALEEGLSPIPDTPAPIRAKAQARLAELGAAAFRDEVVARDPDMARLAANDAQRLTRAWEVFEATGKPLSQFQALPRQPVLPHARARRVVVEPDRETLYRRSDQRAAEMLESGAVEEVKALLARDLDSTLPVMKALGVAEVTALLKGDLDREGALANLQQATRQFAKRQLTWFRNQAPNWPRAEDSERALKLFS